MRRGGLRAGRCSSSSWSSKKGRSSSSGSWSSKGHLSSSSSSNSSSSSSKGVLGHKQSQALTVSPYQMLPTHAVHTMAELKLSGNHLKGSRPVLTFHKVGAPGVGSGCWGRPRACLCLPGG